MRALPIAVVAAAAALTLTACDSGGSNSTEDGKKASTASTAAASSTACKIDQIGIQVSRERGPAARRHRQRARHAHRPGRRVHPSGLPAPSRCRTAARATDVPEEKSATPPKLTLAASRSPPSRSPTYGARRATGRASPPPR